MAEESTKEEPKRRTRSISQLKAFTRCGEAFRLERFLRADVPRRPAAWTILGSAFHEWVLDWEGAKRPEYDPLSFTDIYDRMVEEEWEKQPDPDYWIMPPRTKSVKVSIANYRQRGLSQLDVYVPRVLESSWEISHLEEEFELDLDGIVVRGGVDRILHYPADDTYVVEDIKTGNLKGEDDIRQLAFYAFVARELWGLPVNEGRYWFTKMDRGSEFVDLTKYDKKFWVEEFKKLDRGINEGVFLASPGEPCGICSVKPWCNTMGWLKVGEPLR